MFLFFHSISSSFYCHTHLLQSFFFQICKRFSNTAFASTLDDQFSVKEGEKITLECNLFNPKHTVVWLKNDKQIYPSQKFKITEDGSLRTLTIHDPVKYDDGVYSCALKQDPKRRSSTSVHVDASTQCLNILE